MFEENMKSIEVVAAIIKRDGSIFATQRGYGEFDGRWEFPGGKIEPGESHEDALLREIQEELQATVRIESFIATVSYSYENFHLTMHCYLCSLPTGESIVLTEHSAAEWLDADTIDSVDWLPADIDAINSIKSQSII